MSCQCCFNHYRCAAGAAFVFARQCLLFALACCHVAYSPTTSLPLNVLTPLDTPSPPIHLVGCRVASCCAATS